MTSAHQRRDTVPQVRARGLSLRRSCALCRMSRSSVRYQPHGPRLVQNQQLTVRLRAIARKHPRYGYRRAHALVCREVVGVHGTRVHRIWRQAQVRVPCRRPRRRRTDKNVSRLIEATRPNQVWTYDFVHDRCAHGQRLKILTVTDEFTRESLAIEVATRMGTPQVLAVLAQLMRHHGTPA